MHFRRLLTVGPDNEARWVRLYVQLYQNPWATMFAADGVKPPKPWEVSGPGCVGNTLTEVRRRALIDLGAGVEQH